MNKLIKEFIRAASGYCLQNQLKFYIVILLSYNYKVLLIKEYRCFKVDHVVI